MTKKSYARLRRLRNPTRIRGNGNRSAPFELSSIVEGASAPLLAPSSGMDTEEKIGTEGKSERIEKAPKLSITPKCAIVAAALHCGTTGAIRRQLKSERCLALIILVPGPSWIEPVKSFFLRRFGTHWQTTEGSTKTWEKREFSSDVAKYLASGMSVFGVATSRDALPSTLVAAADFVVCLDHPDGSAIRRAIRMATLQRPPTAVDDKTAVGLEFHDLIAAFRGESSPTEIIARLKRASETVNVTGPAERLPSMEDAIEYGDARSWGLTLARDLAEYRAGNLEWKDVDRGAVLHSEPGLGKSLFARILAKACGVPLIAFSISDLFANSRGDLDSVVKASRTMFDRAAAVAPCILFLDEIDALPNRATMSARAQSWWTTVVTDFLLSLDNAVAGKRAGIVVIGATNNIKGVDAAVLRPGRLERAIEIKRPDRAGALNILRHHLNGDLPEETLSQIATFLEGATGAEIMMTVRSARRIARYEGRELGCADLLNAIRPIEEIAPHILERICIHEAGHAVASLMVPSGSLKRCFIGSTNAPSAGGTVIRGDDHGLPTRDAIERRVIVALCGRAAEEMLIGQISSGGGGDNGSDLARATRLVATLHASLGMGDTITYLAPEETALAAVAANPGLRDKVEQHLQTLHSRAREVVVRYRDEIGAVSEQLQKRRQLTGEEIKRIVDATRPRTHGSGEMPSAQHCKQCSPMRGYGGCVYSFNGNQLGDSAPAKLGRPD